ncbi:uncharacterized protein LOC100843233 [Brachypodium distachyon]|uniref:DUF952 domain-containing protein n=1 Tax=Brachypodium distachyon TaxID=15368 RepID=I1GQI4_BRADI|nr:uncharacterized protein LOC100843233 [Brachypodium distachyon]XP_014754504.1 uncharacterized protein LOC100843233 [Brachypodium distachyon]XP_014754507.1 uncharacterized protein LOC100843233 [Brachypodium distachyon]KQK14301.1 hypothetical protein BRADI_1g15300v3 [Brachypodium distachyon]KQK14302.1 hypothetical protein BRADI_1g15300v3 [Brachypodium distachyon]KQK14303.1 hypothetical protein BRADI_1g15300v3 [Brachypodium distachyon]PNT74478.1 hypothetical protein BRADI_1g15300v3 [Brachypodi|eukprot:XP_003562324.1 uncharacterized protein LOC100843233 [Brachypodium distachyon]
MAKPLPQEFVYRISTGDEWAELERTGCTLGGDLDRSTGCIHLSNLSQVKMTLKNFFLGRTDLYLLQIDTAMLADGLIYEASDDSNYFPHFYGPHRSFAPLLLSAVVKADKIELANNDFTSCLLDGAAL